MIPLSPIVEEAGRGIASVSRSEFRLDAPISLSAGGVDQMLMEKEGLG